MENAIVYHEKVGKLFLELSDLYTQVAKLPVANFPTTLKITRYSGWASSQKDATYSQQLNLIRIYLKMIGDEPLSQDETEDADDSNLMNGLAWNSMVDYMQSLIHWLQTAADR